MQFKITQPYPYYYEPFRLGKLALTLATATTLFLYVFKPVGIEAEILHHLLLTCAAHGIVAGIMFLIYFWTMPKLLPNVFSPDNWTVLSELVAFSALLLLVGLANHAIHPQLYALPNGYGLHQLLATVRNTFIVGFLILAVLTAINFIYLLRNQEEKAELLKLILKVNTGEAESKVAQTKSEPILTINGQHDQLILSPKLLSFIQADGNYVDVYTLDGKVVSSEMKRIPLKQIEENLIDFTHIIRVHRAYLLNLRMVTEITGNAQGYNLKLKGTDLIIPVSRTYMDEFNKSIAEFRASN